ncbi:LOW QUALITY PROTEIN: maestro heat-like repeat-containing protein family member 1 [Nylanderia fulva]|uniref:LOW QUALITY PROTEIN: maestro heat-like repeat-containing protein family member 1 n=1 Tax=Nylanderia fulva TaxID=613905 RepID=UPI0010FB17D0|nr:LOW QUALITY PROTEIN: maestro heat-like repeat-containing protein family member 1 [Nylanderia fulva]
MNENNDGSELESNDDSEFERVIDSELPGIIGALLNSLDDKNQDVRVSVIKSIERISKKNPMVVSRATIYFWEMHKKISMEHMASLLNIMSNICRHSAASLNKGVATSFAEIAVNNLVKETENEAAELLTELCKMYCKQAMGGLLPKLGHGIIPNATIVSTIKKLTIANPYGMLSFIKIILTIMLPMLNQIREEALKQEVCLMISKFCDAINDYMINANVPEFNKQTFEEDIYCAYNILMNNWLKTSRDSESIEAILTALVSIIPLQSEQQDSERIIRLIPICLNLSKKSTTRLAAVKVLAVLLNCVNTESDKETLYPFIDYILQILFEYVSLNPYGALQYEVHIHHEVLKCSQSLVVLYPEEGLDRILQQSKSPTANQRARALVVLKFLINTFSKDDGILQRIALSLQESLGEDNTLQMISVIAALAEKPTFPLLPLQRAKFIRYLVSHCETKNDNMRECSTALHLVAITVNGAESWLWPCLINALLDPSCTASATSVLQSLTPLATKIICSENSSTDERDFPGTKVLGRCLELLSDPVNRLAVVIFLRAAAPLMGHRVKPYWDEKLLELSQECAHNEPKNSKGAKESTQWDLIWENKVVEWLEESVKLEGESWGGSVANELVSKASKPNVALLLASTCNNNAHINLLVELARSHGTTKEFARAVGICAKRHLNIVLKLMEEFCTAEDVRKVPLKLLGLMRDAKAAATAEAAKAGLLQSYAEIARKVDPKKFFPAYEKHVLPWTVKQLNESKELSTKEAGLLVLEQVANAVHPTKFSEFKGLRIKATALTTLLGILQSSTGYRPLQLYPAILKAINSLIRIAPMLNNEEREIFLSAILDKTISASGQITLLVNPKIMRQVIDELGATSSEIVSDSADALAELFDIVLPWMQAKSNMERKTTLFVLHTVLQSYYNSLKYTYPGGKLDAGKLVARIFCWCADNDCDLRPIAIDCTLLSLDIAARHRQILSDSPSIENLEQIKKEITENDALSYGTVKDLARAVSNKIPNSEIVSFAEGLIEGLLLYQTKEAGYMAAICLDQHFLIRGSEISRTDVCLVDSIIIQMRQIDNKVCKYSATVAIISLMKHHLEEVCEHLLSQPLPLDAGTKLCWEEIRNNDSIGPKTLEFLLIKLKSGSLFSEAVMSSGKNNTASLASLSVVVALKYLLESPNIENLIQKQLAELLSILLKYLSGWLRIEAPASLVNTKYGYVPNRAAQKMNPYAEVYSVITNILMVIQPEITYSLLVETSSSETQNEESVIFIVQTLIKCITNRHEVLLNMAQILGKLVTSTIPIQRAIAVTFYTELIGKVDCGVIWLDTIINTLHESKTDSSSLVRKHVIIGLARIAYLDPILVDDYFDNCMDALLNGLEESAGGEGGAEVVLESLRGLSELLSAQYKRPESLRVILALKPFIEKENWEMRLAAIDALGAIATNWERSISSPDDDLIDHLLSCLPSLIIRLEDSNTMVVMVTRQTLCKVTTVVQNKKLLHVIHENLGPKANFNFETFSEILINCLKDELPQRAEELRNAVVRGYSKSENDYIRATSALLLGFFSSPRPEDIQRLLQLLRDKKSIVRIRASQALSFCFTL